MYTFTDKRSDYSNVPQKVGKQFAVYGVLGTGSFGEVRLAFEKVSAQNKFLATDKLLDYFS